MNWMQKVCGITDYSDQSSSEEVAYTYFGIGHGDYDEELGFEPLYIVWIFLGDHIDTSALMLPDNYDEDYPEQAAYIRRNYDRFKDQFPGKEGTHGSIWGHELADRTYKGRYEPETNRLSIVKPAGTAQYRDVPEEVFSELRQHFGDKLEISIF